MIRRSVGPSPIPAWLTLRRSLSVVGAATIGVIVAACGTSLGPADEGLGRLPPPAPQAAEAEGPMPALRLVDAVARTNAARTARTLTLVSIERPGLPQVVTISANGRFDFVNHRGRFDVFYGGLISAFEPGAIRERSFLPSAVVVDGLTLYLNYPDVPDLFVDERIVVRPWVRTAVDELTDELITDLGAAAQLGRSDPSQLLVWLRATGIEVDELGAETIRGIETEHYRTTVDLTEVPEFAPVTERDAYERQIDALVTRAIVTEVPLDVWVDSDNLVRRLASELTVRLGKDTRTSTVGWSVDLFDFGVDAAQGIPREARVMGYADLLQVAPRPPLRQSPVAQPPALEAFPSS